MEAKETEPVITVPPQHRLLLKDLENVRVQAVDGVGWVRLRESLKDSLRQYLWDHCNEKSWKVFERRRIGYNAQGVFVHEDHAKRFFGLLRQTCSLQVTAIAPEFIPKFEMCKDGEPDILDMLKKSRVETVSDELRCQVLRSTFRAADTNGDGRLSKQELGTLMRKLVVSISPSDVEMLMDEADTNKDQRVDYNEFVDYMMNTRKGLISEQVKKQLGSSSDIVRAAFRVWDANGNGMISKEEVTKVLHTACKLPAKDIRILADVMDTDEDGQIDYDEFAAFLYPTR